MNFSVTYRVATSDDALEFQDVLIKTFPLEASCFSLFKHTREEMAQLLALEDIKCFLENDLSVIATAQGNTVGVLEVYPLTNMWNSPLKISAGLDSINVMYNEIIKELDNVNCAADEIGVLDWLTVVQEYWGQGIGGCLVSEAVKLLRSKGFKYAAGVWVNKYSFALAQKHGFEQIAIVRYDEFEYDGKKPFLSSAAQHEGMKLAVKRL